MDDLRQAAREFFRRGLETTGWTPYRWAKAAEVAPTTITRLLNNPDYKFIPKLDTLKKLADAAQVELPSILNSTENLDTAKVRRSIPVVGEVRAGSWQRIPDDPDVREWLPMDVPGYQGVELFAVQVAGRSMDLIYPEGTFVICAPASETGIREDDCVVVRRMNGDNLAETTLKQVVREGDQVLLVPRSSDPAHQTPFALPQREEMAQSGIEILGVVLIEYRKERRGKGPLLTL